MNTLRKEPKVSSVAASWSEVGEEGADQRIDNFLIRVLKGVPKSHLYRLLRTGQVRVNSRRVDAAYRLRLGDRVRLPPVRAAARDRLHSQTVRRSALQPMLRTLLEDDALLAIDKPAGMAAHGGSGVTTIVPLPPARVRGDRVDHSLAP